MKLVRPEQHSVELSNWLSERGQVTVLSSVLLEVELIRATRRSAPERLDRAADVLRGIGVVTLSRAVIQRATGYADANLRSLDAIHLATAEHVVGATGEQWDAFLAYDDRLLTAAAGIGLRAIAPGIT